MYSRLLWAVVRRQPAMADRLPFVAIVYFKITMCVYSTINALVRIMRDSNLKIIFGIISALLLVSLILKLTTAPGGIILSGLFLGGMILVGILIACVLLALVLQLFLRKYSFSTLYFFASSIAFMAYHYQLHSRTLKIIVPEGYTGNVSLVLSSVDKNMLTIDSNGIGYITKWTFKKTWSRPNVYTTNGHKINDLCVGFNPSTFYGLSKFCCVDGKEIKSLSFEIVPGDKKGQKQYYSKNFQGLIDTSKLLNDE